MSEGDLRAKLALCEIECLAEQPVAAKKRNMRKAKDPKTQKQELDTSSKPTFSAQLPAALLNAFHTNNRINQYLIESIAPEAWKTKPLDGKGRTISAIVAHMHNVRVMWLKVSAKGSEIPAQLDRATVTQTQALRGLELSCEALSVLIARSLESDGRIKGFRPDVAGFLGYLIAHDAHHRGQIAMLARQLGHPLPQKVVFGMWEWGSR
jgi:uncharacterized damage-inducible protein DinB